MGLEPLLEDQARTRRRGYATAVGEYELGLNAAAAAVHDARGHVIAAVDIWGPAFRLTPRRINGACRPGSRNGYRDLDQAGWRNDLGSQLTLRFTSRKSSSLMTDVSSSLTRTTVRFTDSSLSNGPGRSIDRGLSGRSAACHVPPKPVPWSGECEPS